MLSAFRNIRCFGLFNDSRLLSLCATCAFGGAIVPVQAQPWQTLGAWQLSAGWQDYSEPQMNLKGPELGVHWKSLSWGPYTFACDQVIGKRFDKKANI
jgi:hypothetical protein